MSLLQNATFLTTVAQLRDLPPDALYEVAFVGRSNAGKSSAINTLANRTRLAYVSKTPGRTQHLNYFTVAENTYLVDLPGYGFAKAPEAIRSQWEGLLAPYLAKREPLAGVVLIMDSRRPLLELDQRMIDWIKPTGRPIHVLLSKSDKLSRQEATQVLRQVKAKLAEQSENFSAQLFSSLKKTGVEEVEQVLSKWLNMPLKAAPEAPKKNPDQTVGGSKP